MNHYLCVLFMRDGAKRWPRLIIPQYTGLERNRGEIRGKKNTKAYVTNQKTSH
jgi:hypothetical protein